MRWLRRIDEMGWPLVIVRLILAYMFITMGWEKAWHPEAFIKLIREYHMVPDSAYLFLNTVGVVLPWLEIVCGVALLLGVLIRGAAALLAGMLLVFTVAIIIRAVGIYQGGDTAFCAISFDCGCGGGPTNVCAKIPENVGLLALALLAIVARSRFLSLAVLRSPATGAAPLVGAETEPAA